MKTLPCPKCIHLFALAKQVRAVAFYPVFPPLVGSRRQGALIAFVACVSGARRLETDVCDSEKRLLSQPIGICARR